MSRRFDRQIEPDPLYRRRLRGQVVNRFVAQKRGIDLTGPRRPSRMGALGRASLYASFALAVSVTGVMAASDAAIPGDVLYPLKRGIEQMRLDVLPDEFHDELVVYALSERIDELNQLVEAGDVARASTLAGSIHDAYDAGGGRERRRGWSGETARPAGCAARAGRERPSVAGSCLDRACDGRSSRPDGGRLDIRRLGTRSRAGSIVRRARPGTRFRSRPRIGPGERGRRCAGRRSVAGAPRRSPTRTPKPDRTPKPEPTPKRRCEARAEAEPEGPGEGAHTRSLRRGDATDKRRRNQ